MSRPIVAVSCPERSVLASRLRRKPNSSAELSTRSTSACWTCGALLMTRDTVFRLTPAWRATSTMVGRRLGTSRITTQRYQRGTGEISQETPRSRRCVARWLGVDLQLVDAGRVVGGLRRGRHVEPDVPGTGRGDRVARHVRRVAGDRDRCAPGRAVRRNLDGEVTGVPGRRLAARTGVPDGGRLGVVRR